MIHLAEVLRRDVPAGRDALRAVLDGPAKAIPITVNGQKRFLIRGSLRASSVLSDSRSMCNLVGDPKGN